MDAPTCTNCSKRFTSTDRQPRIFICGDTFCTPCCTELIKKSPVKCPICKEETKQIKDVNLLEIDNAILQGLNPPEQTQEKINCDQLATATKEKINPKECPICTHHYSVTDEKMRVRSLGCGHPMCTSCLQRMHQGSSVTCPQCRYVHQAESVDRIPITFGMEALILSSCDAQDGSPILTGGLCKKHATMKLFYCDTCKVLVCAHCTVLDHPRGSDHKIIDIQEGFGNMKSRNASDIEGGIKKLQKAENKFTDRIKLMEKDKLSHNDLLRRFENVVSQIRETLTDIDAQHTAQTHLKQEVQRKINQLSAAKQQVYITETLTELSATEKQTSASVKEAENWIKINKASGGFSQLQSKTDEEGKRCRSGLTTLEKKRPQLTLTDDSSSDDEKLSQHVATGTASTYKGVRMSVPVNTSKRLCAMCQTPKLFTRPFNCQFCNILNQ